MSVRGDVHEDAHDTLLEGLDQAQRAALEAPLEAALRVIGGTGSGKSEVLIRRIVRALRVNGQTSVVILAHGDAARRRLREGVRALGEDEPHVESFDALAWRLASVHAALLGIDPAREPIARLEARGLFERCMEPLLAMEWDEIARGELEVELPGLGWPERFRDDAFDLLMRLIDAGISPQALREGAQRGAQAFYGRANLAELARRSDLTERQRASLILDEGTLEAQRRRELALAQVLTRLYRDFVAALDACAAPTDNALFLRLTELLLARPALAQEHRRRHPLCLVDDAHGCLARETALLRALYGEGLAGVTLAGQEPLSTPGEGAIDVRLERRYRAPLPPATTLYRGADAAAEARFVAAELARLIDERGLAAGRMAVIAREPRGLAAVERELIARDVPYQHLGSTTLFDDPNVLDVLALAGVARDPRDAIRLLRTLQTPVMALSDRTLYRLCAPPAGPQAALFEEIAEVERGIRRAERREMLVRNAIAGEADEELTPQARARLRALRLALPRWREAAATLPLDALLVRIADESGYLAWLDGLSTARRRHGRRQLQ
ncbi:MAG: ATP-dependent helicase, partial [bacterium]|nr:ATP-dependent helicase [bacterium]